MPRIPRKSLDTSFFHVIVQGIKKEFIFYKEEYIKRYLYFLEEYIREYNVEIVAYCIMNNHAHILIYTDEIDEMSKFMHIVNTSYAQYYNYMEERVGYVFRDRYLSEPIYDKRYLIKCIQYIHFNPVRANMVKSCEEYKFSTYNNYLINKDKMDINCLKDILNKDDYNLILAKDENIQSFMDIDINKDEILEARIKDFEKTINKDIEKILMNTEESKQLVKYLKNGYKITYVDIMRKLKITKWEMEKIKPDF